MRRTIFYLLSAHTLLFQTHSIFSQTATSDSVFTGAQYKDAVYYNLTDGSQTTVQNNSWHLAFSVQPVQFPSNTLPSVTIRFNEGNAGMTLHQKALSDTAFFTADTSGFDAFDILHDSDTNLDTGAFNRGLNISQFDYGWGVYNQFTKNIPGRNVFFVKLGSGIKKFRVVELTFDTLWQIQYANLDNSNLQTLSIPKKQYQGKLFAYLNMETNEVQDREPLASNWDLLFHRYYARDVVGLDGYPAVGTWSNKGIEVAEARGVDVATATTQGQTFTKNMSEIGRDWKEFVSPVWVIEDSLVYFVKLKNNKVYSVVFTGFGGSGNGKIVFDKKEVPFISSIANTPQSALRVNCFPNPASNQLSVVADNDEGINFSMVDLTGKVMLQSVIEKGFSNNIFDLSQLPAGLYFATFEQGGKRSAQRISVVR